LIVLSPTAPNSSYEEIDLNVFVEYSGPQIINSSVPLQFRYAGNPDITAINPKKIRNTFVYVIRIFTIFIISKILLDVNCCYNENKMYRICYTNQRLPRFIWLNICN